jgi:type II secretory pathway component GspD/PulD (secretin)
VKAVPNADARSETPPTIDPVANELPDSDSYMTCTVRLKDADPQHVFTLLQTASRMPNGIVYNPTGKLLVLRDYSSSIRQMLRLIQDVDHPPSPLVDLLHLATNAAGRRQ